MKIKHLRIENFRAIAEFDQEFGPYTSFIGYNGGGKSSILHAVRWFFEDFPLEATDIFSEDLSLGHRNLQSEVTVTVTFDQLTELDRQNFGPYAIGDRMILTRKGGFEKKSKLYGERLVCPLFERIRKAESVGKMRENAISLKESDARFSGLECTKKTTKSDLLAELDAWESDPANASYLKPIRDEDANHFFGAVGSDKLKADSGFVFIPAAPDLTGQFDVSGKGSALQLLLGDILKGVVGKSIDEWSERNQDVLDELETTVKKTAADGLKDRAGMVNRHLQNYLPGVEIQFEVGLSDWAPKASPSARSIMRRSDQEFLVESEGHGVQRATLLALLQATADSRTDSSSGEHAGSSLIVFIEEPEVYQHPVQARMMARSFMNASRAGNIQFVIATHSPYFLDPTGISDTMRVEKDRKGSRVHRAAFGKGIAQKREKGELDKYLLESVAESLFSRAALVVEGDTERAVFDALACDRSGSTLRDMGISIAVAGGSETLLDMAQLIGGFGVPTFIVRDGDSDEQVAHKKAIQKSKKKIKEKFGTQPNYENDDHKEVLQDQQRQVLDSWKAGVDNFVRTARELDLGDQLEDFEWGSGFVAGKNVAILEHDLETELNKWPSYMAQWESSGLPEDFRKYKKGGVVARVVTRANFEDMPESFAQILKGIGDIANRI